MVNKTLNENTSSAPPQREDLYSKNKTPRGIAEKVYPSPLYPSLPAKKLVRNLSLFFVSSFCTIFSRKLQFRFSLCYLSISKINSTLNVAGTACTDRWSLRVVTEGVSYRINEKSAKYSSRSSRCECWVRMAKSSIADFLFQRNSWIFYQVNLRIFQLILENFVRHKMLNVFLRSLSCRIRFEKH